MTRPTRARTPMVGAGGQEQEEQCAQREHASGLCGGGPIGEAGGTAGRKESWLDRQLGMILKKGHGSSLLAACRRPLRSEPSQTF
mgnify:CR=1 FL=1